MRIVISSGHGQKIRGMRGDPVPPQIDEVDEARRVVPAVVAALRSMGHTVTEYHDNVSTTQSANLDWIISHHNNSGPHEIDCSVHFNAYDSQAHGVEVYYGSPKELAADISQAIAGAGHLYNRGAKSGSGLAFCSQTWAPSVLLEICFGDNTNDCNLYKQHFDAICSAIAGAMVGETPPPIPPGGPEPPERPERPENPYDTPVEQRPVLGYGDEGDDVTDLQRMLPRFEGEIDGDFGSITEAAVLDYQRTRGLDADGLVGQQTWSSLYAHAPPLPPPPPPPHMLSHKDQKAIKKIAEDSDVASYYWDDRGEAPLGYTQGMALAFAQSYRKLLVGHRAVVEMSQARRNSSYDALNVYREEYEDLGLSNEVAGPEVLLNLYSLMLGHGMRESSGKHCCGRDQSATNVESDTAEAGLMQTSFNAHAFSDPEFVDLMAEYSDPSNQGTCYLSAFEQEVSCDADDWSCYGSGQGYQFQLLCKECPPFAVETCALTLRNRCDHYGPIIRGETELIEQAVDLFREVRRYVDENVEVA